MIRAVRLTIRHRRSGVANSLHVHARDNNCQITGSLAPVGLTYRATSTPVSAIDISHTHIMASLSLGCSVACCCCCSLQAGIGQLYDLPQNTSGVSFTQLRASWETPFPSHSPGRRLQQRCPGWRRILSLFPSTWAGTCPPYSDTVYGISHPTVHPLTLLQCRCT